MPEALTNIVADLTDGWQATEARLATMTQERDTWRRKAQAVELQLHETVEQHRAALAAVRVRAACDLAALRAEIPLDESEILVLANWKFRAETIDAELQALKVSYQRLITEHREMKIEYERDKIEREKEVAEQLAKLTRARDDFKSKWEASRAEAQRYKGEADRLKETNMKLQSEVTRYKAEAKEANHRHDVVLKLMVVELRQDERDAKRNEALVAQAEARVRREYEGYLRVLRAELGAMEGEVVTLDEVSHAMRRSLSEELEWQRSENRKVKLLVEGARRAAEEAAKRLAETEARCAAEVEAKQAELDRTVAECAQQVDAATRALRAEEEAHEHTKR